MKILDLWEKFSIKFLNILGKFGDFCKHLSGFLLPFFLFWTRRERSNLPEVTACKQEMYRYTDVFSSNLMAAHQAHFYSSAVPSGLLCCSLSIFFPPLFFYTDMHSSPSKISLFYLYRRILYIHSYF